MSLGGIVGQHGHPRARRDHGPVVVEQVQTEGAAPDRHHEVVGAERLAHRHALPWQMAGELRMVLGEAGPPRERLLPHRTAQPFGDRGHRLPSIGAVGAVADHDRRPAGALDHLREFGHLGRGREMGAHRALGPSGGVFVGLDQPVAHRHHDDRRPALALRLVVGARHRSGNVLGARRESSSTPGSPRPASPAPGRRETARRPAGGGPAGRRARPAAPVSHGRWRSR